MAISGKNQKTHPRIRRKNPIRAFAAKKNHNQSAAISVKKT